MSFQDLNPFYRPGDHPSLPIRPMMNWEIWWKLSKCFFGFHEITQTYGAWAEGWGTKTECWWCGKVGAAFERDTEVDPIPGPLPGCHPQASAEDKERFKRVIENGHKNTEEFLKLKREAEEAAKNLPEMKFKAATKAEGGSK